uniref:VAP1 protein n=1 Tax=Globodera rostochiensis TaxID=31243 RepID=G1JUH0_GLORO|nr:VAP1 protein [Globodera rostochiensis]AHW98763.1 VAP1 protein [Globodera rostochiensis]
MAFAPTISVLCLLLIALSEMPFSVLALSASSRVSVLACHNNYRSTLAKGTAANLTGTMPAGSNLIQQKYSTSAETTAQNWANGCSMAHSSSSSRNGMGENLYMTSSSTITEADALKQACDMWWAELKQYGFQSSLVLDMNQFNKGIGHWSQQAWANTAQLGCAMARCPSSTWKTWVVCNYNASGNYLNQVVYKKGTACSGCSDYSGASCNSTSGLCVLP